jgi:hypothetical protein
VPGGDCHIVGIISTLVFCLLPAVEQARIAKGQPPPEPQGWMSWFIQAHPGWSVLLFPIVNMTITAILLELIRRALPNLGPRFQWTAPLEVQAEPLPKNARVSAVLSVACLTASVLLLVAASHVHADRTNRRPVVTWEGPLADYVGIIAWTGWTISVLVLIIGHYRIVNYQNRKFDFDYLAVGTGYINLAFSLLFLVAIYED